MEVLIRDLYCYECSLQFHTKYVFDNHLSVVHVEKLDIRQDSDSEALVSPEEKEHEIQHPDEEYIWKNESKRRKVSIKTASENKERQTFNCDICYVNFRQKGQLNQHAAIVHEGKKQFKWYIYNTHFGQKSNLNAHVSIVHEGKLKNKNIIHKVREMRRE